MPHVPNRLLLLALPIALAALLIALAVLQYQWVGELSADERRRMDTALRASLSAMARELNEELENAVTSVQFEPATLETLDGRATAAEWNRRAATTAPDLIAKVHLVRIEDGEPELFLLDRRSGALTPEEWEQRFFTLRQTILADLAGGSVQRRRWTEPETSSVVSRIVNVPMLKTAPSGAVDVADIVRQIQSAPRVRGRGYVIAEIDLDVLRKELMPDLVSRYVPDADYRIALVRTSDQVPLYLSSGQSIAEPDATAGVLPDASLPLVVSTAADGDTGRSRSASANVSVLSVGRNSPAVRMEASAGPRWELRAVHRAGSVRAAANRVRRRNLLVGSSILMVLGAGIAIAFVHARRAEALARQQMEFVSVMSHELRTPIAIVNAAAENLSRGVVQNAERGREYGDAIRRETARLSAMVEQVLEFARSPRHETFVYEAVDLRAVVHDAANAMDSLAAESGGHIEREVGEASPVLVNADAEALGRALRNLIGNAIKHSLDAPAIRLELQPTSRDVRVRVLDRGPGVPPEERPHLTEPFFRGAGAIARQVPGSGLGLAIVQRIVEAHHGSLTIESRDRGGSEFTICLPRSEA